jgi:Glycosyl transferase family 11
MVIADMPNAGLANLLHVWARAYVFAYKYDLPYFVNGWKRIHLGPIIRRENSLRYYNYFNTRSCRIKLLFINKANLIFEPSLQLQFTIPQENKCYIFNRIPVISNGDIFIDFWEYRDNIKKEFFNIINNKIKEKIRELKKPEISIHIRRGDFNYLNISTDIDYYIEKLKQVRSIFGYNAITYVFTDADEEEIGEILKINNVFLIKNNNDILDLAHISMAQYIIHTPKSTFSLWSKFLSNIPKNEIINEF